MPGIPLHFMWPSSVNQAHMTNILLHPLLDLGQCIYIEGRWTTQSIKHIYIGYHYTSCGPHQSFEHRCHCIPLHPLIRSRTMHVYRRQMDPPIQSSIDALNTATPNILAWHNAIQHRCSPVNRAQMSCILLHPLLDLVQCMYIEGRWTPQSIKHRCLEYHYTSCGPPQSLEHRCLACCYTHC